jgi:hypothetical protein
MTGARTAVETAEGVATEPRVFRHPPASRIFAAQTGGPSGAEGDASDARRLSIQSATGSRSRAPLGPPVPLRGPEDDERFYRVPIASSTARAARWVSARGA